MDYSLKGAQKYIVWRDAEMNAFVVGNFDVKSATVSVTLPRSGTWYDALTGESVDIPSTGYSISLDAGEYRFLVDKGTPSGIEDETMKDNSPVVIYNDKIEYLNSDTPRMISIYDLSGSTIIHKANTHTLHIGNLPKGIYIVRVKTGDKVIARKFIR